MSIHRERDVIVGWFCLENATRQEEEHSTIISWGYGQGGWHKRTGHFTLRLNVTAYNEVVYLGGIKGEVRQREKKSSYPLESLLLQLSLQTQ